ncbi:TPA_asm: hypothetical protein G4K03_000355 [Salmonella enterica subsp. enterica serovar Typhimurium]|uniref:Uncharacterized protein n=1 Tax=Salmonella typhimurium TaxID=90371 RepID=A0A732V2J6_SALTM|nr:hypothetical protein [Salmonella enterica subsp. enterica serovar Typhimurium]HAE7895696.1 hypothetical protein [Salmonella enterica subsp. enterica serovar Typhimurium]
MQICTLPANAFFRWREYQVFTDSADSQGCENLIKPNIAELNCVQQFHEQYARTGQRA